MLMLKCNSSNNSTLKPNGTFIYVTFGQPHFRRPLLEQERYNWELELITFGETFHYYIYVMRKKGAFLPNASLNHEKNKVKHVYKTLSSSSDDDMFRGIDEGAF